MSEDKNMQKGKIEFLGVRFFDHEGRPAGFQAPCPEVKADIEAWLNKTTPPMGDDALTDKNS